MVMHSQPILALELCVGDCVLHNNQWRIVSYLTPSEGDPQVVTIGFEDETEDHVNTQTLLSILVPDDFGDDDPDCDYWYND